MVENKILLFLQIKKDQVMPVISLAANLVTSFPCFSHTVRTYTTYW